MLLKEDLEYYLELTVRIKGCDLEEIEVYSGTERVENPELERWVKINKHDELLEQVRAAKEDDARESAAIDADFYCRR